MPRERVLQQSFEFLERLDDKIGCTHEETVAVVKPFRGYIYIYILLYICVCVCVCVLYELPRVLAVSSVRKLRIELTSLSSK